ncbi:E3 ubiquitin-protein ligase [Hibiscus syriacus]|uniref:RING-type E3 ubiquitin transferase n=1 Tax=Hibiscus syriacus TaxID=106335 RepID=A0A6A2X8I9_HIBSY|nr:E3 ubiquitin-protein ligase Os04g0590900-like [Hibiscus syriacus]KAE8671701.1 E3 ubiquitin-protein ligase [Hibiscus syriacus]
MGSTGDPRAWVPYMNIKDCSRGFCSLYCPQWCYIIYPPPPPIQFTAANGSAPNFSPLVIAIVGVLASAFLLVSYYAIISKYCGRVESSSGRENDHGTDEVVEDDDHDPSVHEPWQISTTGLDEALIKSITAFKYKKGDGFVEGSDCSVCLNEFRDDESLRLLPKCSHAFHLPCIDTWLRSHSNCPLCRANIVFINASAAPPVTETPPGYEQRPLTNEHLADEQDSQRDSEFPKTPSPSRAFSDLGSVQGRDAVIRIREEEYVQQMRRSISMDHFRETQVSGQEGDSSKVSSRMSVLQCVMNPAAMKRSFSSGRFFLARQGRVRDLSIPL